MDERRRWRRTVRRFLLGALVALACAVVGGEALPRAIPALSRWVPSPSRVATTLWHPRGAKTRLQDPPQLKPMTVAEALALPAFPRYPDLGQLARISALEEQGVSLTGVVAWVYRIQPDDDYLIYLTDAPVDRCSRRSTPDQLIAELTTPWEIHPVVRIEVCCWRELS